MADLSKLRKKIKPVVVAAGGSAILVAGLIGGCSTDTVTSGNLIAPDVVEQDWTSGNLLPPDMTDFDEGVKDQGTVEPDIIISGNLMPPDVQEWDEGPPPKDEGSATDEGTAVDEGPPEPDFFISGNLMPPDVQELPSKDVDDSKEDVNEVPAVPVPSDDE